MRANGIAIPFNSAVFGYVTKGAVTPR